MFRSDLFEGLCVGHAPKKCKICGKWFLTTNARHTKYCGGYAPGDKLHRTCRQIGNLKGREQRELADDHPIIQIYENRLNTINRYIKRGKLDEDLAEVMKKLAKDKMLLTNSNALLGFFLQSNLFHFFLISSLGISDITFCPEHLIFRQRWAV